LHAAFEFAHYSYVRRVLETDGLIGSVGRGSQVDRVEQSDPPSDRPAVSVVIACFTADRWTQLAAAVESTLSQTVPVDEVLVVVDHNEDLAAKVVEQWPSISTLSNRFGRGASGARNTGAQHATSPIVAFLDDDAVAEPTWLERLLEHLDDASVVGVGGGVFPVWEYRRPTWFPEEFAWVVGASYRGMPDDIAEVRNVWAENMAVRRDTFMRVDGFRLNFGKVGTHSSPEDTDLCIRMAANGGHWLYVPNARVAHHVPAARATFAYFVRRSFHEGEGKAALAALSTGKALDSELAYLRRVLPQAIVRNFREALRQRRLIPAAQSGAILVGLAAAAAGYARERLTTSGNR
jgi:glucosyl-dolichyl phosphate glucuronosyltransferase